MWQRSALGKFFIAPAMVWLLAERRNYPLADIAAQMQNEVADTDGFRIGPEPDLFFRKLGQTLSQTRQGFFEQPVPALPDEKLCYFLIEVRHILALAAVSGEVVF